MKLPEPSSEIVNDTGSTTTPAVSLSLTVTVTLAVSPAYSASPTEAAVAVTVTDSSAASASATPDTVTDWAVPQFTVENVNTVDGTDTAPASPDDTVTVTDAVGWVANFTVKLPVPSSEIVNDTGSTTTPAVSLSLTVTVTLAVSPAYSASPTEAAVAVTVTDSSAASASATPDTVTDWAVPQFTVENVNTVDGTDTAPTSPDDTVTVTDAVGWVANRVPTAP